jgi:hypothetical protein
MRFFFDYTKKGESLLDYRGDDFGSPQGAIEFAQAVAHYLKHSLSEDWSGWSVEARNVEGLKFYSAFVDTAEFTSA